MQQGVCTSSTGSNNKPWYATLQGEVLLNAPLAPFTTLKIGGAAQILFKPASLQALAACLSQKPSAMPVVLLGKGSNVLVSDEGVAGLVVVLDGCCDTVQVTGNRIYAEAGAAAGKVARLAREHSLTGAEFLCGIPGSVGGALAMNAGAYGAETMPLVEKVKLLSPTGEWVEKTPADIGFGYRHTHLPAGWIYAAATFLLQPGDKTAINTTMRTINKNRSTSQPLDMPSSGSWFKNVEHADGSRTNAWKIVDEAGCRGLQVGGAQVSPKHSNFFVNTGGATAADMLALSLQVEQRVLQKLGITLHREVKWVGKVPDKK